MMRHFFAFGDLEVLKKSIFVIDVDYITSDLVDDVILPGNIPLMSDVTRFYYSCTVPS